MASSCSADRGTMIARGGGSREQAVFFFYDLAGFVGAREPHDLDRMRARGPIECNNSNRPWQR